MFSTYYPQRTSSHHDADECEAIRPRAEFPGCNLSLQIHPDPKRVPWLCAEGASEEELRSCSVELCFSRCPVASVM
ncbi:hypothetical protein CesoFtcFv8_009718 [Champsocephalus esox]|uniref:Uncharacterized protein n=1 Tax=Champsocephalus esox TaxID=159716 RepID=A0AAN8C3S4_9TELE|nr:hypothetical protein CesoFtcFv8_009718 [Champsocephalus esox]